MKIDHLTIDEVRCFENSRGNGVVISWSADIGHGELTLYRRNEDDMWKADTQYMCTNEDKEFIRMVLNKWVDEIEVEKMTREEAVKRLDEQAFKELKKEPYKDFCEFVAKMVLRDDFEENAGANAEILCRKLSKLGIVKANEDEWVLVESEGKECQESQ